MEWTTTGDYIEQTTYRGHEGVHRYLGSGRASGAPVSLTLISVGWLRDGMAYRIRNFPDMAAALEAAGLSE